MSGRKLALHSDVQMGASMQSTNPNNKIQKIGTWNVQTMHQGGKLENVKIELKKLGIDI